MKVLLINGSPRQGGTYSALKKAASALEEENIETEIINLGATTINDCIACGSCSKNGDKRCVLNDNALVNEIIEKAKDADGFIFGSPVYYAHANGRILSLMDRLFYAGKSNFEFKPAAAVACARRAGTTSALDDLNKYFTFAQMPVVSSNYWNEIHGNNEDEASRDEEGMLTMYNLGKNMAWMIKCINLGKENGISHPDTKKVFTNFIR